MSFIGIVTESKKEIEIKQALKNHFDKIGINHTIIIINDKSIENIKNVKFEILVVDINILNRDKYLTNIMLNTNTLIVNSDYEENLSPIRNLKLNVITYGMNSKATLTLSSSSIDYVLVTLQRSIKNINNELVEPQEIKIFNKKNNKNLYLNMILAIFSIIFDKI